MEFFSKTLFLRLEVGFKFFDGLPKLFVKLLSHKPWKFMAVYFKSEFRHLTIIGLVHLALKACIPLGETFPMTRGNFMFTTWEYLILSKISVLYTP